jgi:hypothetical protein
MFLMARSTKVHQNSQHVAETVKAIEPVQRQMVWFRKWGPRITLGRKFH